MQTFLPLPGFKESARVLDWRRLGNQRKEARQILQSTHVMNGWSRHTAVLMWIGYQGALIEYGNIIIKEWIRRGYVNNMPLMDPGDIVMPPWFGDDRFHASHRSNLLRKLPEHYNQFGWKEGPDMPYFWPTKEGDYEQVRCILQNGHRLLRVHRRR
jgi:hypothetical protein